ncbi:MAG: hypothetical protein IIW39_00780 [Clostridia bacterium]|nr:hypothetical protein [Clostridia bacterium]
MKKLITLILIFSLAIACLVSCAETENEISVDIPDESSVVTESSLTVEESSEEENSEQSEETIEIPEFDINNVLYCSVCVGPEEGCVAVDDVVNVGGEEESDYGFKQNFHNYKIYPKYDEEAFKTAYLYVIVILYSSDNNVPKEVLCDFLEAYGYVENKEKTTALGEIEGVEQATVGYLPWIMLQKLSSDCRSDEYKVYYSWLSKSCLGEDCQYYAPPLK